MLSQCQSCITHGRTTFTGFAGGSTLLRPKMASPAPRRGVNPGSGRDDVLASAATCTGPECQASLSLAELQGTHMVHKLLPQPSSLALSRTLTENSTHVAPNPTLTHPQASCSDASICCTVVNDAHPQHANVLRELYNVDDHRRRPCKINLLRMWEAFKCQ